MVKPISKEYVEFCKKCNNEVKLCQTCHFFRPIVFSHEDEYYDDEDLGIFTLWIWEGYCMNESMPNIFPALYHKTKSNKKCKWYVTKEEYETLSKKFEGREITFEEYNKELKTIRETTLSGKKEG